MLAKITDYDHFGRGIVREKGKIVFVPKTKKGEIISFELVEEKKNYAIGKRCDLEPSTFLCPHYPVCGGCQLLHLSYEEQIVFKQEKVRNILMKYTGYSLKETLDVIKTEPFFYRNKVILHIHGKKIGFFQEGSHQLFSLKVCSLLKKSMQKIIDQIRIFITKYEGLNEVMIRVFDKEILLSLKGTVEEKLIYDFFFPFCDVLFYNEKSLTKKEKIAATILNMHFVVSKDAFFQVNDRGLIAIYQRVIDLVKQQKSQVVFDLYCGTGTISLLIAPYVKMVYGIELNKHAILDAEENRLINHLSNVFFAADDVGNFLSQNKIKPDTVIVDPPRSGLGKKAREVIKQLQPTNLIYISCDPMTLARDIEDFRCLYTLMEITLVDEFPNTYHCETIVLLRKKR